MLELTQRQRTILKAIIERYIESALPVGSEVLERDFNLGVSPATIRNEMVRLTELGYIQKPHTSAGRIPTSMGLKFYIRSLMSEKNLSVRDEVMVKEHLWDNRFTRSKLLRQAARELALKTHTLAVVTDDEGQAYASGASYILDMPEFYDIDLTKEVLTLVDEIECLHQMFARTTGEYDVNVLLGEEIGNELLAPCGFVFTRFTAGNGRGGYLGVVGPMRLPYPTLIPTLRYFGTLLTEVCRTY